MRHLDYKNNTLVHHFTPWFSETIVGLYSEVYRQLWQTRIKWRSAATAAAVELREQSDVPSHRYYYCYYCYNFKHSVLFLVFPHLQVLRFRSRIFSVRGETTLHFPTLVTSDDAKWIARDVCNTTLLAIIMRNWQWRLRHWPMAYYTHCLFAEDVALDDAGWCAVMS